MNAKNFRPPTNRVPIYYVVVFPFKTGFYWHFHSGLMNNRGTDRPTWQRETWGPKPLVIIITVRASAKRRHVLPVTTTTSTGYSFFFKNIHAPARPPSDRVGVNVEETTNTKNTSNVNIHPPARRNAVGHATRNRAWARGAPAGIHHDGSRFSRVVRSYRR